MVPCGSGPGQKLRQTCPCPCPRPPVPSPPFLESFLAGAPLLSFLTSDWCLSLCWGPVAAGPAASFLPVGPGGRPPYSPACRALPQGPPQPPPQGGSGRVCAQNVLACAGSRPHHPVPCENGSHVWGCDSSLHHGEALPARDPGPQATARRGALPRRACLLQGRTKRGGCKSPLRANSPGPGGHQMCNPG